ncbi:hypothetical protein BGX21_008132 [Mortierella sp. AD011]|nr:hypothetical protein BGX20_001530 [Mortierella sp. AD010]KAF9398150.1 hypothetical protein BGX21_008132 [Mortierella sp. AD011]
MVPNAGNRNGKRCQLIVCAVIAVLSLDERQISENLIRRFLYRREQTEVAKRSITVTISSMRHGFMTVTELELFKAINKNHRDEIPRALGLSINMKYRLDSLKQISLTVSWPVSIAFSMVLPPDADRHPSV